MNASFTLFYAKVWANEREKHNYKYYSELPPLVMTVALMLGEVTQGKEADICQPWEHFFPSGDKTG